MLIGLDRWADNEFLIGNVELLDPFLLMLTLELLFDNRNLLEDTVDELEGVPVSLLRDEL